MTSRKLHDLRSSKVLRAGASVFASIAMLVAAAPALASPATPVTWADQTDLILNGPSITLHILAGSKSSSFSVTDTSFTVTVALGDTFVVEYPGPTPGTLANSGGASSCNIISGNNRSTVTNATVTFTPTTTRCFPRSGHHADVPISAQVSLPNGGEMLIAGQQRSIAWTSNGTLLATNRVSFSANNGSTWSVVAASVPGGFVDWTVPNVATTKGLVKVEALLADGTVAASDVSDANFTIGVLSGSQTSTPPDEHSGGAPYVPADELAGSPNINADKGLDDMTPPEHPLCVAGSRIKLPSDHNPLTTMDSAVYYCGKNGKRYVFATLGVYRSWFADFTDVLEVSPDVMSQISVGGNVTYRPGARMIKLTTDLKTYAIAHGGVLRWVTSQDAAVRLYGENWNKLIDDVPDTFFADFRLGDPIY